jgi:hypothetical protein
MFGIKPTPEDLAKRMRLEAQMGLLMAQDARDRAQAQVDYYTTRIANLPEPVGKACPPAPPRPPAL